MLPPSETSAGPAFRTSGRKSPNPEGFPLISRFDDFHEMGTERSATIAKEKNSTGSG
jgi:hypothetical protein